jgi:hypothetical protein
MRPHWITGHVAGACENCRELAEPAHVVSMDKAIKIYCSKCCSLCNPASKEKSK